MLIILCIMAAPAWNMLAIKYILFFSINESKPVQFLMTQSDGFRCYMWMKTYENIERVKSLKEPRI